MIEPTTKRNLNEAAVRGAGRCPRLARILAGALSLSMFISTHARAAQDRMTSRYSARSFRDCAKGDRLAGREGSRWPEQAGRRAVCYEHRTTARWFSAPLPTLRLRLFLVRRRGAEDRKLAS